MAATLATVAADSITSCLSNSRRRYTIHNVFSNLLERRHINIRYNQSTQTLPFEITIGTISIVWIRPSSSDHRTINKFKAVLRFGPQNSISS